MKIMSNLISNFMLLSLTLCRIFFRVIICSKLVFFHISSIVISINTQSLLLFVIIKKVNIIKQHRTITMSEAFKRPTRSLSGRVAVVTGAGAAGDGIGNGRASAILLAEAGCNVVCVDIKKELAKTHNLLTAKWDLATAPCPGAG